MCSYMLLKQHTIDRDMVHIHVTSGSIRPRLYRSLRDNSKNEVVKMDYFLLQVLWLECQLHEYLVWPPKNMTPWLFFILIFRYNPKILLEFAKVICFSITHKCYSNLHNLLKFFHINLQQIVQIIDWINCALG